MRVLFTLILSFFFLGSYGNPVFNHLQTINKYWQDHPSVDVSTLHVDDYHTATDWIRLHLTLVEKTLRSADISTLSPEQKANRLACLNYLHGYLLSGRFPQNEDYAYRTPIFIDKHDNFCAVGYLIKASGHEAISRKIAAENNLAYVHQLVKYPELINWAKENGFTVDELAWIQPTYAPKNGLVKVGKGTNGYVNELYVDNNTQRMYIGGGFSMIDSAISTSNVAYVTENNGVYTWHDMGSGVNGVVNAIVSYNSNIYVGGTFSLAGGNAVNDVAKWDGTNWQAVGCLSGTVKDLMVYNGSLYASGLFDICNSATNVNFAKWDGTNWTAITGLNGVVNTMEVKNNNLYLGGNFSYNAAPANVIRWNNTTGFQLVTPYTIYHEVTDIGVYNDTIYACCKQTIAGNYNLFYKFNGNTWTVLAAFNSYLSYGPPSVNTMCVLADTFLIGGDFYYQPLVMGSYIAHSLSVYIPTLTFLSDNYFLTDSAVNKMVVFKNSIFAGGKSKYLGGIGRRISAYQKVPLITTAASTAACAGASNGTLSVTASWGVPPYSYLWSTGDTSSVVNNVPAGTYTVVVTDAGNDKDTLSVTVASNVINTHVTVVNHYLLSDASAASYQWVSCDNGYAILPDDTTWKLQPVQTGSYAVIINKGGCIDTSACYNIIGTKVENIPPGSANVIYPNPCDNELNIVFEGKQDGRTVKILDASGKVCISEAASDRAVRLNTKHLAPAVYMLVVEENGKNIYQSKIVRR